jgi:DNA-binding transcriptional MerR regulator
VAIFKLADLLRSTGATSSQLDYWLRLGLIVPLKEATSSGDHRQFSILNVIQVAMALWLSVLGMSTDRMKQVFANHRKTLTQVPDEQQAVQAWLQYVEMVRAGATLIGLTDDPAFKSWEREVATVMRRFKKTSVAPDADLLALLAAQPAALRGGDTRRGDAR